MAIPLRGHHQIPGGPTGTNSLHEGNHEKPPSAALSESTSVCKGEKKKKTRPALKHPVPQQRNLPSTHAGLCQPRTSANTHGLAGPRSQKLRQGGGQRVHIFLRRKVGRLVPFMFPPASSQPPPGHQPSSAPREGSGRSILKKARPRTREPSSSGVHKE